MRVNELTDNEKRLCENLNKYMKFKQKKGVDLANQLDITTASASRMMTGVSVPNVEQVLKICEFCNEFFFGRKNQKTCSEYCRYHKNH